MNRQTFGVSTSVSGVCAAGPTPQSSWCERGNATRRRRRTRTKTRRGRRRGKGNRSDAQVSKQEPHWCTRALSSTQSVSGTDSGEAGKEGERCLLWYKHDLRVDDHPGLKQAFVTYKNVTPVFVFDPEVFSPFQESKADVQFIHEVLESLREKLRELGSGLVVRVGKAEEVIPALCEEMGTSTVVTQKEANCLWADKVKKVSETGGAQLVMDTYTYTLFGENNGWRYPTQYTEMQEWGFSQPVDSGELKTSSAGVGSELEQEIIPSAEEMYASMMEAWQGTWPGISLAPREEGYRSAYCGEELLQKVGGDFSLSGKHDEVEDQLKRYLRAFAEDQGGASLGDHLESLALNLEVPGGFGQSFNVLFRKHLSMGVVSPGRFYRLAGEYKSELDNPMSSFSLLASGKFGSAFKGAKACMGAAIKYDFAHNMHQYSLESESLLDLNSPSAVSKGKIAHKSFQWRGTHQEFIEASPSSEQETGEDEKVVVLIHGFGAFGAHWRDNIAGLLSRGYKVYSPTLPGYGRSEKASAQYTPQLWSEYVRDFILNIVKEPVVIAGNSIGGYISAYTSAKNPDLVKGLILVNTAGRLNVNREAELPKFVQDAAQQAKEEESQFEGIKKAVVAEVGSRVIFAYLGKSVPDLLKKAYPIRSTRADEKLSKEIERASADPGAFDVFKSVFYLGVPTPLSSLLEEIKCPTMVFQGTLDPLNDARGRAKQIKDLFPDVELELVEAGHCPHDEVPDAFNNAVDKFYASMMKVTADATI